MVGKIETLKRSLSTPNGLVEIVQVRNGSVISYSKNIDGNQGGNRETLKQSLKCPVDEVLEDLYNDEKEIDLENWIEEYKHYYEWKQKYFPFQLKKLGTVSNATQKRMRKLIENSVNAVYTGYDWKKDYQSQPYLTFLTTTLPSIQVHTDKVIKRAFTLFLENLVKTYNVKFYLWKAEAQKNGNIHFHVIVDRYIDHKIVNRLWNNQMKRLGYIDRFSATMLERGFVYNPKSSKSREIQNLDYLIAKKDRFQNPTSTTQIKSLKGIQNVAGYMIKYMTKNEENKRPILGRVWGCSRNIKFLKYPEFVGDSYARKIVDIAEKHLKRIDGIEFVIMYKGYVWQTLKKYGIEIFQKVKEYYLNLNKQLYEQDKDNLQRYYEPVGLFEVNGSKNIDGYQTSLRLSYSNGLAF